MRKIIYILVISVLLIPLNIKALTINDLKAKLNRLAKDAANSQNKISQKDSQINNTRKNINNTIDSIEKTKNNINQANLEINRSNNEISSKDKEIKELAIFLQVTKNESFYLEYVFGSDTIEDFIYRIAITKQLAEANQERIKTLEHLIEVNNQKKKELAKLQTSLEGQQNQLSGQLTSLGQEKAKMLEDYRDINLEIKQARDMIRTYERAGCKPNQNIATCNALPPGTAFWRPTTSGRITSEYGWRIHPIYKVRKMHVGMDLSGGSRTLYAVGNGKVATTYYDSGGGRTVVIHHRINGRNYTSTYMHLSSIKVKKGQIVSKDTVIGIMGTTGNSTGIHLHLSIATCLRYQDCISYESWASKNINPRSVINFPSGGGYWSNRTQRY